MKEQDIISQISSDPEIRYDQQYCEAIIRETRNQAAKITSNFLLDRLKELSAVSGKDVLLYAAPYVAGTQSQANDPKAAVCDFDIPALAVAMKGMGKRDLYFIIHSHGGDPNAASHIIDYIRKKYQGRQITAVVPHKAMSAASMMCMGCDDIIMSKFASLGPVDPQFDGMAASAILLELERALKDVDEHPNRASIWAPRILQMPQGIYQLCEDATAYTKELVQKWLKDYMFKEYADKADGMAYEVAEWLASGTTHKLHARPLTIDCLLEKRCVVSPLENDDNMQNLVMGVFHAFRAVFDSNANCVKIIVNQDGEGDILFANR